MLYILDINKFNKMKQINHVWQNGSMEQFVESGAPTYVIGISLDNSYFSQENIEKILSWCDEPEWAVSNVIMIPDEPFVHTLVASGIPEQEAIKKARLKANALENKCKKVQTKNQLEIYRWSRVKKEISYIVSLDMINSLFLNNESFKKNCCTLTRDVLINRGVDEPSDAQIHRGVRFILEELAFIYGSKNIAGAGSTCYVYHKKFDILYYLLSGQYSIPGTDEVFSLILDPQ